MESTQIRILQIQTIKLVTFEATIKTLEEKNPVKIISLFFVKKTGIENRAE